MDFVASSSAGFSVHFIYFLEKYCGCCCWAFCASELLCHAFDITNKPLRYSLTPCSHHTKSELLEIDQLLHHNVVQCFIFWTSCLDKRVNFCLRDMQKQKTTHKLNLSSIFTPVFGCWRWGSNQRFGDLHISVLVIIPAWSFTGVHILFLVCLKMRSKGQPGLLLSDLISHNMLMLSAVKEEILTERWMKS